MNLTKEEQNAYNKILDAAFAIQSMGLKYNNEELAQHIRGLQMFVHQHVLYRMNPGFYSDWYS